MTIVNGLVYRGSSGDCVYRGVVWTVFVSAVHAQHSNIREKEK